jgi:hypothetical protein
MRSTGIELEFILPVESIKKLFLLTRESAEKNKDDVIECINNKIHVRNYDYVVHNLYNKIFSSKDIEKLIEDFSKLNFSSNKYYIIFVCFESILYANSIKEKWELKTDSSVQLSDETKTRGKDYFNLEFNTPILYTESDFEQVKFLCDLLNDLGCYVNDTCGLHVHIGIKDFSAKKLKNLILNSHFFREIFNKINETRKTNPYCKQFHENEIYSFATSNVTGSTVRNFVINYDFGTKYRALNYSSFIKYETVEFRQHKGSINFEEIRNWSFLLQDFVEYFSHNFLTEEEESELKNLAEIKTTQDLIKVKNYNERQKVLNNRTSIVEKIQYSLDAETFKKTYACFVGLNYFETILTTTWFETILNNKPEYSKYIDEIRNLDKEIIDWSDKPILLPGAFSASSAANMMFEYTRDIEKFKAGIRPEILKNFNL